MASPIPSFFKIRLVLLVISFFLFCFFIGFIKNAFPATWPGECARFVYRNNNINVQSRWHNEAPGYVYESSTGALNTTSVINTGIWHDVYYYDIFVHFWNPELNDNSGGWEQYTVLPTVRLEAITPGDTLDPEGCGDSCESERQAIIDQCGGEEDVDWTNWNDETCSGAVCVPVCDKTDKLKQQNHCPATIWFHWDEETCTGVCGPIGDCSVQQIAAADIECGGKGIIFTNTTGSCEYDCDENCDTRHIEAEYTCSQFGIAKFDWNSCDYACDKCPQEYTKCVNSCVDKGGVKSDLFDCVMSVTGQAVVTCVCTDDDLPEPPVLPDPVETPDKPADPVHDPKPEVPDPVDPPVNPYDKAIKDSIDRNAGLIDKTLEQSEKQTGLLNWIGNSLGAVNDNIGGMYDYLGDVLDFGDDIAGIEDAVDEINQGTYRQQVPEDPYSSGDHDFSVRTESFLNQMKSTGLFSIPGMITSSIPGGGSPLLTISTGETFGGDHVIDFSTFDNALLILRYLFQIAGMIIAIRIVTLKR